MPRIRRTDLIKQAFFEARIEYDQMPIAVASSATKYRRLTYTAQFCILRRERLLD